MIRTWDLSTGTELSKLKATQPIGHLVLGPDGVTLLTWPIGGGELTVWDLGVGKVRCSIPITGLWTAASSANGQQVATSSRDEKVVRVWDVASGMPSGESYGPHDDAVLAIAFSNDGKKLVTGSRDKTTRVFDVHSRKLLRKLGGSKESVGAVALSQNGKWIASGEYNGRVRIWDAAKGKQLRSLVGSWAPRALTFSNDSTLLAEAGVDQSVYLWDAASGQPILWPAP